ncbi:hypothetical protein SAMN02746066_02783 [Anaerosporobacter mobilis DSM 15930]|uniref:Uncharacterized protein n=1 Tax=Anaerosporobacter mobilis DSM 15930 TaxID=1120996 RepID=A0A1M7KKL8_9FIRM|nr:hypothetical protein [Anaerosporobacter mobilis]SHM65945.1 hypothetical protein SAMN02746066_02783 [Anaerosporobacter mobilis DSM 15930]
MFIKEDNTFNDMRKNSTMQWLEQLLEGEDVVDKHGAKLTLEYIEYLNHKNDELKEQIALRDDFLRRLKSKEGKK